ncbi:MAG: deaminase, partial [Rhodospirillales bacterium]
MSKSEPSPMRLALAEARDAGARGEVPVGAVVVDGLTGHVVVVAGNRVEELADPSAHAEILAIREA